MNRNYLSGRPDVVLQDYVVEFDLHVCELATHKLKLPRKVNKFSDSFDICECHIVSKLRIMGFIYNTLINM